MFLIVFLICLTLCFWGVGVPRAGCNPDFVVVEGNKLVRGFGRLRSSLWIGVAPKTVIFRPRVGPMCGVS